MKIIHRIATVALFCFGLFLLAAISAQLLYPQRSPIRDFLSSYALGRYGIVMTIGFWAEGIGELLLALGLWRHGITNRLARIGFFLVGIGGLSLVGVALFPTATSPTIVSQLHDLFAVIHFLTMAIGATIVAWHFQHYPQWRQYARSERILALLIVVALLLFFTLYPLQTGSTPTVPAVRAVIGLFQRFLIGSIWLWLVVTTVRLRHIAGNSTADTAQMV